MLLCAAAGGLLTYRWSQSKYYIGDDNGTVAIFQGVPTNLFGLKLSHTVTDMNMKTSDLPPSWQEQLTQGISFDSYDEAKAHTTLIQKQLKQQERDQSQKNADNNGKTGSAGTADANGNTGTNTDANQSDGDKQ